MQRCLIYTIDLFMINTYHIDLVFVYTLYHWSLRKWPIYVYIYIKSLHYHWQNVYRLWIWYMYPILKQLQGIMVSLHFGICWDFTGDFDHNVWHILVITRPVVSSCPYKVCILYLLWKVISTFINDWVSMIVRLQYGMVCVEPIF